MVSPLIRPSHAPWQASPSSPPDHPREQLPNQDAALRQAIEKRAFAGCGFFSAILRETCFEVLLGGLFVGGYAVGQCLGAGFVC
jgi:hypothetical protein